MKRINIDTGKIYKKGDKPTKEDLPEKKGKFFNHYRNTRFDKNGYCLEIWLSPKQLYETKIYHKKRTLRKGIKEINPSTNKIWTKGEICPRRGYFWEYHRTVNNNGKIQMTFYKNFKRYHIERISSTFMRRRIFAKEKKLPFDITREHLQEIFPKNFKCPILGTKLEWGHIKNGPNNPSLDRKKPEKGYVIANCMWISYRANTIKNDATSEELKKIYEYLVENKIE